MSVAVSSVDKTGRKRLRQKFRLIYPFGTKARMRLPMLVSPPRPCYQRNKKVCGILGFFPLWLPIISRRDL